MNQSVTQTSPLSQYLRGWQEGSAPDIVAIVKQDPDLPWEEIAAICCVDLKLRFEHGDRRPVEDYLLLFPPLAARDQLLLDLLYAEYVARKNAGENPVWEEFEKRFPHLSHQIERQFSVDELLSWEESKEAYSSTAETITVFRKERKTDDPHPASIGRYPVLAVLDAGGQAIVYRGIHPVLQKEVVIKLGRGASRVSDQQAVLEEGRLLAELDHPNLCRVYDLDFHEGRAFLVLEYIRGQNLHQIASAQKLSPAKAAEVVAAIAQALEHAHKRGIIHQDVKPKNILIDPEGRPRLIDFGLARLRGAWKDDAAENDVISGTIEYMAPEQAQGHNDRITTKTDLFSLGGVLYFLLTGKAPFSGGTASECLSRAAHGNWDAKALEAPGIPPKLAAICKSALSLAPEDRPMTARDIANSLENATRPVDRRWMIVGAAAAIALFVFCLAVFNRADPQVNPKLSGNQKEQPREAGLAGEIKVTAWVGERYVAMPEPAPLRNGSKLRIECEVPANMHAAIVNIASDGAINVLTAVTPAAEPQSLGYPEKHGTAAKLGGNEGTEIFLLLVRPDRPIDAEELQAAFDKSKPWPILPDVSVLELRGKKVKLLQKSRDLTPADQEDPEGDASRKLEVLGKDLMQRYAEVHAIAFKHKR